MIVKFHARGAGRGSGPVEYLLGKERSRDGATLDRGDPDEIQALIDSSPYAKKYTSGVLSFEEADLDRQTKDKIMSSFEKALLPGLEVDQYSCLWVEHRDKGRLELNFVVPNVELQTGKRLQPYFDRADKPRINAWKTGMNASLKLHDPDDPINKRELTTPRNLPASKQEAARAITDGLLSLAGNGELHTRQDVVNALEGAGFTVARQTPKSISIADPDGGRNIRLKGQIYEQDFKFGAGLREEIEAASARYRATSQERIREAREVYRTGVEIKRAENQKRYKRPESTHERVSSEKLALDSVERVSRSGGLYRRDLVAREYDSSEPIRDQSAECHDRTVREERGQDPVQQLRQASLRQDRRERTDLSGRVQDFERVLNHDRARTTAIERIRKLAESTREATQRLCDGLQQLGENVRHYLEREHHLTPASQQLKRSGQQLEHSAPAVGKALQHEKSVIRHDRGMGFSR
jgi:hypothetical protein